MPKKPINDRLRNLRRNQALGYTRDDDLPKWAGKLVWSTRPEHEEWVWGNPLSPREVMGVTNRVVRLLDDGGFNRLAGKLRRFPKIKEPGLRDMERLLPAAEDVAYRVQHMLTRPTSGLVRAYADLHVVQDSAHKLVLFCGGK